jgi:hypothetical protein
MPHSSDDPPSAPTSSSVERETPGATVADIPDGANPAGPSLQDGEAPQPRRRRRRRRRRPPPTAGSPGAAVGDRTTPEGAPPEGTPLAGDTVEDTHADAQGDARRDTGGDAQTPKPRRHRRRRRGPPRDTSQQSPVSADVWIDGDGPLDSTTGTPGEDPTHAEPPPGVAGEPPRPRRRRRRPARRTGLMDSADSGGQGPSGSEAMAEGTSHSEPGTVGRPWPGRPRDRRPPDRAAPEEDPRRHGPRQPRERAARPGAPGARGPDRRDQGSDTRGQRDRRSSSRPPGRGREAPLRKPEQKLYALESVVDRGFEDVTEDSDEGGTRRVHWTIIKRTVADQKSGKAMSASYVLRREGVDAEFPNLGAARAAVNKTIVHPEKLTLSKAEHVAAKGSR